MFKDKLKELRQSKNITQATLADKIYVSRSAVAKWEQVGGLPGCIVEDYAKTYGYKFVDITKNS